MNTTIRTELHTFAKQIAEYVTFDCKGEPQGFEIEHNGYTAFVDYGPEYREVRGGDSYCGIWEIAIELVSEYITVAAVWDEEGNEYPKIAEALQVLLN